MEDDPGVPGEPGFHLVGGVGGLVVDDDVQLTVGVGGGDGLHEGQELAAASFREAAGGDLAGSGVQGGEEVRGAVPDVVVGAFLAAVEVDRQQRLGPVEGLDLCLLVDAEDDRPVGRVQVQADDVSTTLSANAGSFDSLKAPDRYGRRSWARHRSAMKLCDTRMFSCRAR